MKKAIVTFLCFMTVHSAYGGLFGRKVDGIIRVTGGAGLTADVDVGGGDRFQYNFGTELYKAWGEEWLYVAVGLGLGYTRLYKIELTGVSQTGTFVNTLLLGEVKILLFTLKLGIGPYWGVGDTSEVVFVTRLETGLSIPISKSIFFPITIKTDFLFGSDFAIPISLSTGLTFYL